MQRTLLLFVFLTTHCVSLSGEVALLTLKEAVEFALEKNYSIRIKELDVDIGEQNIKKEKGSYDPTIQLSSEKSDTYLNGNKAYHNASISGQLTTGTKYRLDWGLNRKFHEDQTKVSNYGVTISQPLLKGLGFNNHWAYVKIADKAHSREEWLLKKRVLDTILAVIESYNRLFISAKNADIAERNRDLAKQLLFDNRKRVEQGMMAPVDIAVAEAELAVREERLLKQNSSFTIQKNALRKLIFSHDEHANMKDFSIQFSPESNELETNFEADFGSALEHLPEIQVRRIGIEIEEILFRHRKNMGMPEINLYASYGHRRKDYTEQESNQVNTDEYSYGLRVEYPIRNRRAKALTSISRIRLRQEKLKLSQLLYEIKIDLNSQITLVKGNRLRVQASQKARELSQLMLDAEQKKLKAGTSSTFVILRLQNDLAKAQIQEYQTLSEYNISLAHLNRLRGLL